MKNHFAGRSPKYPFARIVVPLVRRCPALPSAQPRTSYNDASPTYRLLIDSRYLSVERAALGHVRRMAVLDAYDGMRIVWSKNDGSEQSYAHQPTRQQRVFLNGRVRTTTVDSSCMLSAFSEDYAFMVCRDLNIASHARLGGPATSAKWAHGEMLPQVVAVYALGAM